MFVTEWVCIGRYLKALFVVDDFVAKLRATRVLRED